MTRIFQAILLFAGFIKVLTNVQLYEELSFLIKMMSVVIVELVPFFILFISLNGIFAFMMAILGVSLFPQGEESDYEGLGALAVGYFFYVLRLTLGDFDVSTFQHLQRPTIYVVWLVWTAIVFLAAVIFLNFLIAVISDVYARVIDTRMEEVFQKKAEILIDIHDVMETKCKKEDYNVLVTRQISQNDYGSEQWSGLLSTLKTEMANNLLQVKQNNQKA
jgi:hypothetical protein